MKITEVQHRRILRNTVPESDELTSSELMMIIQLLVKNGGHQKKIRKLGIMMKRLDPES